MHLATIMAHASVLRADVHYRQSKSIHVPVILWGVDNILLRFGLASALDTPSDHVVEIVVVHVVIVVLFVVLFILIILVVLALILRLFGIVLVLDIVSAFLEKLRLWLIIFIITFREVFFIVGLLVALIDTHLL